MSSTRRVIDSSHDIRGSACSNARCCARWVTARQHELLDVPYVHVVFHSSARFSNQPCTRNDPSDSYPRRRGQHLGEVSRYLGFQFRITIIGGLVSSVVTFIRKRPSAATSYCCLSVPAVLPKAPPAIRG